MKYLVLSCSLNPRSRSRKLAHAALDRMHSHGAEATLLDLSTLDLPICDGDAAYSHPHVAAAGSQITAADGLLVATPIYNFDVNASAKNLLELTGDSWAGKVVGFLCAAGGQSSYMSVLPFANSLMLDFRCFILPRYVYAPSADADDPRFGEVALAKRVDELVREMIRVTSALGRVPAE